MTKYIGEKCIVCKKEFNANDDIVVCPECGTPYHRHCYAECGECINNELHENGESWKSQEKPREEEDGNKKCPYCGNLNKPHSIICEKCGTPLVEDLHKNMSGGAFGGMNSQDNIDQRGAFTQTFGFEPGDKYCGMDPEEDFEKVKLGELADFVGKNQIYYLPIFKKIKDGGSKISLNIISFIFPELYFANRKMWLWTAISIVISTVMFFPMMIYMFSEMGIMNEIFAKINIESRTFEIIYDVSNYVSFAFKLLMLLFSNWLYYRHALNKIKRRKTLGKKLKTSELAAVGGTSLSGMVISLGVESALMMLIMLLVTK